MAHKQARPKLVQLSKKGRESCLPLTFNLTVRDWEAFTPALCNEIQFGLLIREVFVFIIFVILHVAMAT